MTSVELSQQTIKLEPPQRLLLLEVISDEHGLCLRMFPAGGAEIKGLSLVSRIPVPVSMTAACGRSDTNAFDSMAMMARLSEAFPELAEIDLSKIPAAYDITFGQVASPFFFKSGARYRASGVGEHVWETTVVAK
ncbi:MAG TPA: hypothetical protein VGQ36_25465 [Thermoanaerobaculia bacterium]|nr:hypothetical protein [Thermoanaerobaculia bacterium]